MFALRNCYLVAAAPGPSLVKVRVQHPPEASVKIHQVLKVTKTFFSDSFTVGYFLFLSSFFSFVPGFWIQSHPADTLLLLLLGVGGRSSSGRWRGPGPDAKGGRHVQPALWVQVLLQRGQRGTGETKREDSILVPTLVLCQKSDFQPGPCFPCCCV